MRLSTPSFLAAVLLACAVQSSAVQASDAPPPMQGFSPDGARSERALEKTFDAQIDPAELRDWMKQMSAAPNNVGTPKDKENAEFMLGKFKQWGWDAHIETFYVLYPTPLHQELQLLGPKPFTATLAEPTLPQDATSAQDGQTLPAYNAYGADGDVSGELVYVNYGMPQDYKDLARRGIDVKGRIVIARYGGGWRGLKPKLAYEHGAIGCIIYSDPADDGYARGDVYPKGGWRPPEGVQRGSVMDFSLYSGDPLTPGVGATKHAKRLARKDAPTLLKIPVLPIGYADAQPLLSALGGPVAPEPWRGALGLTYHIGPGPARVHLAVQSDWSLKPIYDVIATIPGRDEPDQWVLRGNHHDGWTFGAWDPLSGNVALLEEAKAIGALLKTGWRPRRTLVYASWDGEEPGLLGSTEWAETHAAELQHKAVMYLNSDTNSRGFLQAGGSHSLQALVNQVAAGITDPETGVSVQQRLRAKLRVDGFAPGADDTAQQEAKTAAAGGDLPIQALGSGSDFTPFLQHLGIASLDVSYGGEDDQAGVYHSDYDSFDHYVRFGDPGFAYGAAESRTTGHLMLRVADAEVLPFQYGGFADSVARYVRQLHELADTRRTHAQTLTQLIDDKAFQLAADPTRPVAAPEAESAVPFVDFAPLDNAAERLSRSARNFDEANAAAAQAGYQLPPERRKALDVLLQGMEPALTDAQGLPRRGWFKHMIYAPGMYTGYGVKTIPAVREGIEDRHWDEADRYAVVVGKLLQAYADRLDRATALLAPAPTDQP